MHWNEVWYGKSPVPRLARGGLAPLSWIYSASWRAYAGTYALGLKKAKHPHLPVLCVGNLSVGGSGKTPLVVYLARVLSELGWEVVIGCSGYGSPAAEGAAVAPEGMLSPSQWGDEPALIREKVGSAPIIVGRNRVRAAELCHQRFPRAVLLMDDGFQHLPLRKDIAILLEPEGENRMCLPAGPLREPFGYRSRADLIIPGHFCAVRTERPLMWGKETAEAATPAEANVLCGLGSPEAFLESVEGMGVKVHEAVLLPDHATLMEGNLFARLSPEIPIIVTLKDWVKVRERPDLEKRSFLVADLEVRVEPEQEFRTWIQEKLHEVVAKKA